MNEKLMEPISLYNQGKYHDSHGILIWLWTQAPAGEKQIYEAFMRLVEGMSFAHVQQWEKAKDFFLDAWKKLGKVEEKLDFIDVYNLKEESYTAAVAAERVILGEAPAFDLFYAPRINVKSR